MPTDPLHSARLFALSIFVAVSLGSTPAVPAFAQCTEIDAGRLKLKPVSGAAGSKLVWTAKDKARAFLIADPTAGTTSVEIWAGGVAAPALTYGPASASAWRSSGRPVRLWKYGARHDPSPIDGIGTIRSKAHQFQIRGGGGVIDSLPAPLPLPLAIRVTDSSGDCFTTRFRSCRINGSRSVKCNHEALPEVPDLVFQSGFEFGTDHQYVSGTAAPCTDDLIGDDRSVLRLGDWETDLEGGPFGSFHFCFGGGDRTQRRLDLVADPDDPTNTVLRGRIVEPNEVVSDDAIACNGEPFGARKSRIQAVLQDGVDVGRIDYRVRMRLGADAMNAIAADNREVDWLTIAEFWNNLPAEPYTFRITLNMIKRAVAGERLEFGLKSDWQADGSSGWNRVWPPPGQWPGSGVEVPIGEWFTLEVTVVEGNESTGRVRVLMTDADGVEHTVADVTDRTYSPVDGAVPDGIAEFNPLKLYTSGTLVCALKGLDPPVPLEIWWDDFAIGSPD